MERSKDRFILLVDDNPDDVDLALHAFRAAGIPGELVVKGDGVQAVDYLLAPNTPMPVVLLLDLKLPRVSGVEVLRAIRSKERTRLLPVVVLTTSSEERDLVESYRLGANSYIVKPVDFARFVEVMRGLATYWLEINQSPPVKEVRDDHPVAAPDH